MTNYISRDQLKNTLSVTGETFLDEDIDRAIAAASRGIDELCNDQFFQGTATRYYDPASPTVVKLRPSAGSVTSVKVDEDGDNTYEVTLVENTDYVKWPYNNAADSRPWWELRIHPNSSRFFPTAYPRSVEVDGLWGWASVPKSIEQAAGVLAAKLIKRSREAPFGIAVFGTEGGMAMRIARNDPDVMFLVGPYMRDRVTVA